MAGTRRSTPSALTSPRSRRPNPCVTARNAHYAEAAVRRFRVLRITAVIAALVSAGFGFYQLTLGPTLWPIGIINIGTAVAFLAIPQLRRFGELAPPLAFTALAYGSLFFITWNVGTGTMTSINALLREMEVIFGPAVSIEHLPLRPGDVLQSCVAVETIRNELGWGPTIALAEGLRTLATPVP